MKTIKYTLQLLALSSFIFAGSLQAETNLSDLAGNIQSLKTMWETAKAKTAEFKDQASALYTQYKSALDMYNKYSGVATDKASEIEAEIKRQTTALENASISEKAAILARLTALTTQYEALKKDAKATTESTDWSALWEKGKKILEGGNLEELFGKQAS